MTYKEACKIALDVQNACNLSGVVRSWSEALSAVWDEARRSGHGTDWVNTHPVSVLFSDKVLSLTGSDRSDAYRDAYSACSEISEGV